MPATRRCSLYAGVVNRCIWMTWQSAVVVGPGVRAEPDGGEACGDGARMVGAGGGDRAGRGARHAAHAGGATARLAAAWPLRRLRLLR